ncbi:TPA: hypothetical protein EYP66_01440 [Candidatus Poribacteria bacterium]|nr:hypothetical protein [Candidatus Poribacteria bacterium]
MESEHKGEALAIEVESGDYFLGKSAIDSTDKGRQKHLLCCSHRKARLHFPQKRERIIPMIRGYIDEDGMAMVNVTVGGIRSQITIPALVDTGFDGHVYLLKKSLNRNS